MQQPGEQSQLGKHRPFVYPQSAAVPQKLLAAPQLGTHAGLKCGVFVTRFPSAQISQRED